MRIVQSGRKVRIPTRRPRHREKLRQDLLKSRALLGLTLEWTPNRSDEMFPADPMDAAATVCTHFV